MCPLVVEQNQMFLPQVQHCIPLDLLVGADLFYQRWHRGTIVATHDSDTRRKLAMSEIKVKVGNVFMMR